MALKIIKFSDNPAIVERLGDLEDDSFPAFLNEEPTWKETQGPIFDQFAQFHYFVVDDDDDSTVGVNINVPLAWDMNPETLPTYNGLLKRCLGENTEGKAPTALVGIFGAVTPDRQGEGVATLFNQTNHAICKEYGIPKYMSPVRSAIKHLYPNYSFEDFISWRNSKGGLIDPWLNYFVQRGGKQLVIARDAITVEAPIHQWSDWTGMAFPVTGDYVIPGGQSMLAVDCETDRARYGEDHLWFDLTEMT